VWPAIERDGPVDHEVESFLTHARRSVMRNGIDKEDRKKKKSYHSCGSGPLSRETIRPTKR
jgi:hypothetical protein